MRTDGPFRGPGNRGLLSGQSLLYPFHQRAAQSLARLVGFFWGLGLARDRRCPSCGAPMREPFRSHFHAACRNCLCSRWCPF